MELRIVVGDEAGQRALTALCSRYGYDPASGLTQAQFVRDLIKRWLKDETLEHERAQAAAAARTAVSDIVL